MPVELVALSPSPSVTVTTASSALSVIDTESSGLVRVRVLQRGVLRHADDAARAVDRHRERRRPRGPADAADHQVAFLEQEDAGAVGRVEAGIHPCGGHRQRERRRPALLVGAKRASGRAHDRGRVLRKAGRAQIGADIADAREQRHHRRRGRVVGIRLHARGLVMRHRRRTLHDRRRRPVVLELHGIADAGRSRRRVAVAVGDRHHRQQRAVGDRHRVVGIGGVRVLQRGVLRHADDAARAVDRDGERRRPRVRSRCGRPPGRLP